MGLQINVNQLLSLCNGNDISYATTFNLDGMRCGWLFEVVDGQHIALSCSHKQEAGAIALVSFWKPISGLSLLATANNKFFLVL